MCVTGWFKKGRGEEKKEASTLKACDSKTKEEQKSEEQTANETKEKVSVS